MKQRWWVISAAFVSVGWVSGLGLWGRPEPGFSAQSDAIAPAVVLLPSLPLFLVAGWLITSKGRWHHVGIAAVVMATVVTSYSEVFAHFGGMCLDPEDACNVRWLSRLSA